MDFGKIKSIIALQLGVDECEITEEASLLEDLNADSLDIVELIMALEDEYNIEMPEEDVNKLSTVGDILNYIKAHAE